MAGSIGDLLLNWTGNSDPRDKLAMLAQAGGAPAGGATPGQGGGGAPMALVPGGVGAGAASAPPVAPQPAAYESPPDLISLYTELAKRKEKVSAINSGLGLMASAFAHPENRAALQNYGKGGDDAGEELGNVMKLKTMQAELEKKAGMRANLPAIAKKYGLDLDTATYLFNSGGLDNVIQTKEDPVDPSADIKEYNFYTQQETAAGKKPMTFAEWSAENNRAREEFGLVPQYTVTPNSDPLAPPVIRSFQTSKRGGMKEVKDPEGNPIAPKAVKSETDNAIIWTNPYTNEIVKTVDKGVYKAAFDKKEGEKEAETISTAKAKLPNARLNVGTALRNIDEILADPALDWSTGASGIITRNSPGTPWNRVDTKIKSFEGGIFLDAYESLKGGGPITDIEGVKGTLARAQANAQNDPEAFRKALRDARQYFVDQLGVVEATAEHGTKAADDKSRATPTSQSQAAPAKPLSDDELVNKWKKK